jgi:hypothetical protein
MNRKGDMTKWMQKNCCKSNARQWVDSRHCYSELRSADGMQRDGLKKAEAV